MRNALKTKFDSQGFRASNSYDENPLLDSGIHEIDDRILFTGLDDSNDAPSMQELRIESFPIWYFSSVDASTAEIANVLDILIRDYQERLDVDSLLIPSVIELSLYFQCPEVQIYDAFEILKRKQYDLVFDANCSKVHVSQLRKASRSTTSTQSWEQAADDGIDWRDITHDFYTDVVVPVKQKLAHMFG